MRFPMPHSVQYVCICMSQGILIVLLLGIAANAFSQPFYSERVQARQSDLTRGEPLSQFENKFRIGFFSTGNDDIALQPRVILQGEVQYSMFGSVVRRNTQLVRYKTTYLLLPVLAKYHLQQGLSIVGGAQAGLLIHASSLMDGRKYDFKSTMRNTDWFFVTGLDYEVRGGLSVGIRYQHGLRQMGGHVRQNRGFSLDLSYEFGVGIRELLKTIW